MSTNGWFIESLLSSQAQADGGRRWPETTARTPTASRGSIDPPPNRSRWKGLGSAIAVVCSWHRNRSILWAIVAGILSWFYVIYFALTRAPDEMK